MESASDILFEYLKNILFNPSCAHIRPEELPPEFRRLGEGLQFLEECVKEHRTFARSLAKGDLSVAPPRAENVLAAPIKELQGSLRHLAWQTGQIAKGDYGQKVDFMGEFSDSFNMMTKQLRERTDALIEQKKTMEQKNAELKSSLALVLALTNYTHNMIFVLASHGKRSIFANQPAEWFIKSRPHAAETMLGKLAEGSGENFQGSRTWDMEVCLTGQCNDHEMTYYGVESFCFNWENELAVVHIVIDETERRQRENFMHRLAYLDPLTGLNNRRFAEEQMSSWIRDGIPFTMSFIDMDYLKYCNDKHGHQVGNDYIIETTRALNSLGGKVCRIGGDEFLILVQDGDRSIQDSKLNELRNLLKKSKNLQGIIYPKSFSYATVSVPSHPEHSLNEFIQEADMKMYVYKRRFRLPLKDLLYRDNRNNS